MSTFASYQIYNFLCFSSNISFYLVAEVSVCSQQVPVFNPWYRLGFYCDAIENSQKEIIWPQMDCIIDKNLY